MMLVRCVQKHGIDRSCSSGCAFRAVSDVAYLALPSCFLLTLPGEFFPIFGVLLSPFSVHMGLRLLGEEPVRYNILTGSPVSGQVLCIFGVVTLGQSACFLTKRLQT